MQITVSNIPGQRHVVGTRARAKESLTREVTVHPDKAAFPFPDSPGSDHDKLKSHLFELLHTIQSVWDRQSIVNSGSPVILVHLPLWGRASERRINENSAEETVQRSPWVSPNRGSVNRLVSVVWARGFTCAPVIVVYRSD